LLVANLDYSDYVGRLAIGRIFSGEIRGRRPGRDRETRRHDPEDKNLALYAFEGLKREPIERAQFGEIVALAGMDEIEIGETITSIDNPAAAGNSR